MNITQYPADFSPEGCQKILFICHPDDLKCIDDIFLDIRQVYPRIIFYSADSTGELDGSVIDNMQLAVVLVTERLLNAAECAAMILFRRLLSADKWKLPVLPILISNSGDMKNLIHLYDENQYISAIEYFIRDDSLRYRQKLKRYLEAVLADPKEESAIMRSFLGHIFLSYRKTNSKYVFPVMQAIHNTSECVRFSIWYDDFLVPGEDYNGNILNAITQADFYVLLVTPDILQNGNYIMTHEYPDMCHILGANRILPIEVKKTPADVLMRRFPGLPAPVSIDDAVELDRRLFSLVKRIPIHKDKNAPRAEYLTGMAYLHGIGVERDSERAIRLLQMAADHGSNQAFTTLGVCYKDGIGVHEDAEKAFNLLEKAAEKGNLEAKYQIYALQPSSLFDPQLYEKELAWLREAAQGGLLKAQVQLADALRMESQYEEAFKWNHIAARRGDPQAQFSLFQMYDRGLGTDYNTAQKNYWLRHSAEQGFPPALIRLGKMQEYSENYAEAFRWYHQAAAQKNLSGLAKSACYLDDWEQALARIREAAYSGDAEGQYLYALACDLDDEHQDHILSQNWYTDAAAKENFEAMVNCGVIYDCGLLGKRYPDYAKEQFLDAAENGGITRAIRYLNWMEISGNAVHEELEHAVRYMQRSSNSKKIPAHYLSFMFKMGTIRIGNPDTVKPYLEAAEQNDADAQFLLGLCYEKGLFVQQNTGKAEEYYQKAADQNHALAAYQLAFLLFGDDIFFLQNTDKAIAYFRKSAEQNFAPAMEAIADYMYDSENIEEAVFYYREAAQRGLSRARIILAHIQ